VLLQKVLPCVQDGPVLPRGHMQTYCWLAAGRQVEPALQLWVPRSQLVASVGSSQNIPDQPTAHTHLVHRDSKCIRN